MKQIFVRTIVSKFVNKIVINKIKTFEQHIQNIHIFKTFLLQEYKILLMYSSLTISIKHQCSTNKQEIIHKSPKK